MIRAGHVLVVSSALLALHAAAPAALRASEGDSAVKAEADRLFAEGKSRLEQRDYAQACPLLARSFELDPATGALLALAVCREREGKLASAFEAYNEAATRSQREQRSDREQAARERAAALEPKLSKLTLSIGAAAQPIEVHLNGERVEPARLGKPIAVDGGDQLIEASAEGKHPFRMRIAVAPSADAQTVLIPELVTRPAQPAPPPSPEPVAAPAPPAALPAPIAVAKSEPRPQRRTEAPALSATQWVGLGSMGLGVVGLGIGTYFALADDPEWDPECAPPRCLMTDRSDPDDAAALAFVAGGVLAASGLAIYLIGGAPAGSADDSASVTRVTAWVVPSAAGVAVDASF